MFSLAFDIGASYTTTYVRRPKPSLYDRRPRGRERVPVHTGGDVASRMEQLQRSVEGGGGGWHTGGGPWNIGKVDTGFLEQDEERVGGTVEFHHFLLFGPPQLCQIIAFRENFFRGARGQ